MVIRYDDEPDDVFFIEAIGGEGVGIDRFSRIKEILGRGYRRIAMRHLEWDRPEQSIINMEKFIKEVNGADYQFKLS